VGRRRLLVLAGAVVVAAGGVTSWLVLRPEAAATTPVVVPVTVGAQRQTVSASGTVAPAQRADLNFAVDGEVTEVLVAPGDQVAAGQELAEVDDTLLTAQLAAAESELDAAQDRAEDADGDAAADAAVLSAESAVAAAQDAVDQATLTATIAGTVAAVDLAVGDRVTTSPQGGGEEEDPAQFTIVSAKTFVVEARVATTDVDQVKAGLAVDVMPTGVTEPVAGTVATVGLVAEADESGAATFPVTIAITGERDDLYAGTSATVSIVVAEREDVLSVPSMALHTEGSDTFVYKMVGGERVRTDVEVGAAFGPQTEILSGLAEGDEVEVAVNTPENGGGGKLPEGDTVFGPGGGKVPDGGELVVKPGGGGR
jgi:macrolide-specific efflux system membrane fusion protein